MSFSVTPHEIQLLFDLMSEQATRSTSRQGSPVKTTTTTTDPSHSISKEGQSKTSRDDSIHQPGDKLGISSPGEEFVDEEDFLNDGYFGLLASVLSSHSTSPVVSKLPSSFFSFTSLSSLSLPPIKSFPVKGFSFSTVIRLESLSSQLQSMNLMSTSGFSSNSIGVIGGSGPGLQRQVSSSSTSSVDGSSSSNQGRMFLFSFKSSTSPPIGFSAYFSSSVGFQAPKDSAQDSSTTTTTGTCDQVVKLTVSCLKGSSSPSLTHTLSFPFPVFDSKTSAMKSSQEGREKTDKLRPSTPPQPSEFLHLALTFSSTSLCLYINGELIESNLNDWTIGGIKGPVPSFDRCVIGCPSSQSTSVKGASASAMVSSNDTGFRGQVTSIYLFSGPLSPTAVGLLSSMRDTSNSTPQFGVYGQSRGQLPSSSGKGGDVGDSVTKAVKELNSTVTCLYSPVSVNWPIVLQGVTSGSHSGGGYHINMLVMSMTSGGNSPTLPSTSTIATQYYLHQGQVSQSSTQGHYQGPGQHSTREQPPSTPQTPLTSHALLQGNLEVVQRSLLIDSIHCLTGGSLDVLVSLLQTFIREGKVKEFSSLFKFILELMVSDHNGAVFLEDGVTSNLLRQVLLLLTNISNGRERKRFLSLPSSFLPSIMDLVIRLVQESPSLKKVTANILTRVMDSRELEVRDIELDKYRKLKVDAVKQVLELFIFNSFLWNQLLFDPEGESSSSGTVQGELDEERRKEEETLSLLYSFISSQLLSLCTAASMNSTTSNNSTPSILLRRKRRSAFLLQVIHSLQSHYFHRKYPESLSILVNSEPSDANMSNEQGMNGGSPSKSREEEYRRQLREEKKMFDLREKMVSLIRSRLLVFIKSLLTKASHIHVGQGSSNSGLSPSSSSSSTSSTATATNIKDGQKEGQSSAGIELHVEGGSGDQNSSNSSANRSDGHLLDVGSTVNNSNSIPTFEEDEGTFDEEVNTILNYLSVTSRDILSGQNSDRRSLLNLIDVLSLLNSLIIEVPISMIPSFDSRKGIHVLFQIIGNTIRRPSSSGDGATHNGPSDDLPSEQEEREVIRSLCLKILGSFLMRSTYKRKSAAMTSSHFSILYYMLSKDRSIISHSLYVNLMEITIEAPISSLFSLQANQEQSRIRRRRERKERKMSEKAGHDQNHQERREETKTAKDSSSPSKRKSKPNKSSGGDFSDDDAYWCESSCDDEVMEGKTSSDPRDNLRPSSGDGDSLRGMDRSPASNVSASSGNHGNRAPQTIKIENPQMIKVIALLVVRDKTLADQFLKDLHTLLLESRTNRRLILQMSVWQSWLISFLKVEGDHREKMKRETRVVSLFKILLYHALRWEFGGWRVWIDSLAIIHSFLSREAFNRAYSEQSQQSQPQPLPPPTVSSSNGKSNSGDHTHPHEEGEDEDEKPEDERVPGHNSGTHYVQQPPRTSTSNNKRLPTPTYRIPAFRWSRIHIRLLDSLLSSIIADVNCFRKEALMRANMNGSPTPSDNRDNDSNEGLILESILMNSDIYVINVIHLISQLTDSTILDAGGLLPLLAQATSSTSSNSNTSKASKATATSSTPPQTAEKTTPKGSKTSKAKRTIKASIDDDPRIDLMDEKKATELLHQLVFLSDYLIFTTTMTCVPAVVSGGTSSRDSGRETMTPSAGVSLAELEAEKNMSSGGLLRQILRLVSIVAVKRVLALRERKDKESSGDSGGTDKEDGKVTSSSETEETSSDEDDDIEGLDDDDDLIDTLTDDDDDLLGREVPTRLSTRLTSCRGGASKFLVEYLDDREDESEHHLLLSHRDIQRLRSTLYRSELNASSTSLQSTTTTMTDKERTNSNFLSLATMYFLSVLLVSKYRDTLDVVGGGGKNAKGDNSNSSNGSAGVSSVPPSNPESDLSAMEKSLYPTVQFLKEIISDFEIFLGKSLLGSKGQTLLTKNLVKRVKSPDCSPLEVVMLLCAQEFQNSLQKNAGLAFIELINEGRLLSMSMKEHVIRVGIEADFILSRIEREERDRDQMFRRECFLMEDKRSKEIDLSTEVIAHVCGFGHQVVSGIQEMSASGGLQKTVSFKSSKRKSFRDLEEFLSEKRMVLFKEDFMMQDVPHPQHQGSRPTSSDGHGAGGHHVQQHHHQPQQQQISYSMAPPQQQQWQHPHHGPQPPTQQQQFQQGHHMPRHPTISNTTRGRDYIPSTGTSTMTASSNSAPSDDEVVILRERVKLLMDRISGLTVERDQALDELHVLKEKERLSSTTGSNRSDRSDGSCQSEESESETSATLHDDVLCPKVTLDVGCLDQCAGEDVHLEEVLEVESSEVKEEEAIDRVKRDDEEREEKTDKEIDQGEEVLSSDQVEKTDDSKEDDVKESVVVDI